MLELIRKIKKPRYKPLNQIEIIKQNILDNFEYLQNLQPQAEIFPVLKSNAYGHGLKEMCKILNNTNIKMLAVDSFPEAQIIYKYSNKKALIIGEMAIGTYKYCNFKKTEFCIYNLQTLKYLAKLNKQAKIHLFINSGMNREGIQDLQLFLNAAKKYLDKIEISGFCSHLASADEISNLNKKQEEKFFADLEILHQNKIYPKWIHLGNSAGAFILNNQKLTAFRTGIAFYGYNIFPENHPKFQEAKRLKPALRVVSKIVSVQNLKMGDKVSYNETFEAPHDLIIATLPFGYTEGLDRRLSNRTKFLVKTKKTQFYAKVAGRICMNLASLNCENNKVQIGDEVEIISAHPQDKNSLQNLAKLMDTIPYEILVKLQGNIRREIV